MRWCPDRSGAGPCPAGPAPPAGTSPDARRRTAPPGRPSRSDRWRPRHGGQRPWRPPCCRLSSHAGCAARGAADGGDSPGRAPVCLTVPGMAPAQARAARAASDQGRRRTARPAPGGSGAARTGPAPGPPRPRPDHRRPGRAAPLHPAPAPPARSPSFVAAQLTGPDQAARSIRPCPDHPGIAASSSQDLRTPIQA